MFHTEDTKVTLGDIEKIVLENVPLTQKLYGVARKNIYLLVLLKKEIK